MDENAIILQEGTLWEMTGFNRVITLIGAGGKTTTLLKLAEEMADWGQSVVTTTTTKVYPMLTGESWCDSKFPPPLRTIPPAVPLAVNNSEDSLEAKKRHIKHEFVRIKDREQQPPVFWYAGVEKETGKWIGPDKALVDLGIGAERSAGLTGSDPAGLTGKYSELDGKPTLDCRPRCWVIEGDGARGKKLKCWGAHEPQIPERTECSVLLLDAGLWGHPLLPDDVHHPERCPGLAGKKFTAELFWQYLKHSPIWAEDKVSQCTWAVLFNVRSEMKPELEILSEVYTQRQLLPELNNLFKRRQSTKTPQKLFLRVALSNVLHGRVWWLDLG